jgi:hypothetical protein
MKAVLIDVLSKEKDIKVVDVKKPFLKSYYDFLNCSLIDIVGNVEIGPQGNRYDIIVDDEGLLKRDPEVSAICMNYKDYALYGNLLIVKHDDEGGHIDLDENDVLEIKKWAKLMGTGDHDMRPLLFFHV